MPEVPICSLLGYAAAALSIARSVRFLIVPGIESGESVQKVEGPPLDERLDADLVMDAPAK